MEGRICIPYSGPHGYRSGNLDGLGELSGLPRFEGSIMQGKYPFVKVELIDSTMPVSVSMEAFTPFIPLSPEDSGIPCGIIKYCVKNTSSKAVDVTIGWISFQCCRF